VRTSLTRGTNRISLSVWFAKEDFMSRFAIALAAICLFAPAARAQDVVKVDPKEYKVEFENDQVRVVRGTRAPHSKVPMHEHPDYVVIYLTDVHQKVTAADGTVTEATRKAGEVAFNKGLKHAEESLLDQPVEVILVELKTKPAP
jgi:hypothetical protein